MTVKVVGPGSQAALEAGVTHLLSNKRYALFLVFPDN